ncbi:MAG: hypothetical protein IPJ89_03175 [Candidatus Iainarchaeum archaeon]|uniref:Uncharacterized protein n=1 Tax=Candidatus Iainarchaeum sp. TaxID=3101447 RepID=A0A7T9DIT4_9ARCH|nr:MAG: hypothetical protein IPJ89_03175 [Candidatus Diapherotrites archaeon]
MESDSPPTKSRGQSTVEMLVAVAIATVILAYLVNFTTTHVLQLQQQQAIKTGQIAVAEMADAINGVNAQGIGAQESIIIHFPRGIDPANVYFSGKSIVMRVYDTDITATTDVTLTGSLPTTFGPKQLLLTTTATGVHVGSNTLSSSAASIYLPMARDSNQTTRITLTNHDSSSATLSASLSWSHTLVTTVISPSSGTIVGNAPFDIDLNAVSTASAIGNYTGTLTITATFSDRVETFAIPINVEVFSNTGTLMNILPASLYFTTLGADSNAIGIQICNTGNAELKNISFIPSSGNAGDWIESIATIATLSGQSCTTETVTITVPGGTSYGHYLGSLAVTDYSGANNQVIPIELEVFGQAGAFLWDWNGAYFPDTTTVQGFKLKNNSSGAITLSQLRVQRWWACDSNHAQLEEFWSSGGDFVFSPAADDNETNAISLNISGNGIYQNNFLYFTGNISDEGEQFQSHVTFSDGSVYSSGIWGTGCFLDTTAPGTVTNLVASPGPDFRTIRLNFTSPGDDNFTGTPVDANLRYSLSSIDNESEFNSATPVDDYYFSKAVGGYPTYITVSDLNIGPTYYFAAKFRDEAYNWSGLSNTDSAQAFNSMSIEEDGNSFQFFPAATNVTGLVITDIQLTPSSPRTGNLLFHIDSNEQSVSYTVDLNFDFGARTVNRVRVWYPTRYTSNIKNTAANVDNRHSNPYTTIDLLSTTYVTNVLFQYAGNLDPPSAILISNVNTFIIEEANGIMDANITITADD